MAKNLQTSAAIPGFFLGFLGASFFLAGSLAWGTTYYVREAEVVNASSREAALATALIRNSVVEQSGDDVTNVTAHADYVLQPKLLRITDRSGESMILTIEKHRGREIVSASQVKIFNIEDLDKAVRRVTFSVMRDPVPPTPIEPLNDPGAIRSGATSGPPSDVSAEKLADPAGATTSARIVGDPPTDTQIYQYWIIGLGAFDATHMGTNSPLYGVTAGHKWLLTPQSAVRISGEGDFSNSGTSNAYFLNLAAGTNYYFVSSYQGSPYATADIGYGYAQSTANTSARGFSFGLGLGYEFFRSSKTGLDILVRYAMIADKIPDVGNPAVIGARLAVNF